MADKQQVMALVQGGQWPKAKEACLLLCKTNSADPEAWFFLAGINAQLGMMDEVILCCQKVIALQPANVGAYYNLGVALQSRERHEEAAAAYWRAVDLEPGHSLAHANLGLALRECGQLDEAIASCRKAIGLKPDLVEALNTLGLSLRDQGQLDQAVECLQQAVKYRPGYAEGYFNLGLCFEVQELHESAEKAYRRAADLQPGYIEVYKHLGLLLEKVGRFSDAVLPIRKVVKLCPDNPDMWALLGSLHGRLKQSDEAILVYQRMITLQPDNGRAYFSLGIQLQEKGLIDEAIEKYRQAVQIDPGIKGASYLLAALGADAVPVQSPSFYIQNLFDGFADNFDQLLVEKLKYKTPELLAEMLKHILGPNHLKLDTLDLGCGTGLAGVQIRGIARTLTGVDLSEKMLEKARHRNVYDTLLLGDVMLPLSTPGAAFDLIIATDVFIYIGDLSQVFDACAQVLELGGLFAFSTEREDGCASYVLRDTGRYAHSLAYIEKLAEVANLTKLAANEVTLRMDKNKPVTGNIFIFRK